MRPLVLVLPFLLALVPLGRFPDDPDPEQVARGQEVFSTVCAGCHTVNPPPDSAPPMAHVARHLRTELGTLDAFTEHVRTYVALPAAERSLLPPMAVERFGLMAPLPLGDSVLTDVAAYIWTLADSARGGMGQGAGMRGGEGEGMGQGCGMGGMRRHGNHEGGCAMGGCPMDGAGGASSSGEMQGMRGGRGHRGCGGMAARGNRHRGGGGR